MSAYERVKGVLGFAQRSRATVINLDREEVEALITEYENLMKVFVSTSEAARQNMDTALLLLGKKDGKLPHIEDVFAGFQKFQNEMLALPQHYHPAAWARKMVDARSNLKAGLEELGLAVMIDWTEK